MWQPHSSGPNLLKIGLGGLRARAAVLAAQGEPAQADGIAGTTPLTGGGDAGAGSSKAINQYNKGEDVEWKPWITTAASSWRGLLSNTSCILPCSASRDVTREQRSSARRTMASPALAPPPHRRRSRWARRCAVQLSANAGEDDRRTLYGALQSVITECAASRRHHRSPHC